MHPWLSQLNETAGSCSVPGSRLLEFLEERYVVRILEETTHKEGYGHTEAFLAALREDPGKMQQFLSTLNNTWSSFFRDPLTFGALEKVVFPLFRQRKGSNHANLRIWSSACASGEEPYSLAMLAAEFTKNNPDISCQLFATDINAEILAKANHGGYTEEAMANLPLKFVDRYFHKRGSLFYVIPLLRKVVDFSEFDLLSSRQMCPKASIFGNFDLIFCANLLFYYRPESQKIILDKITGCLARDGFLVTGDTEREIVLSYGYREYMPHTSIYRLL